jgi:cytochrome c oxidase subunit 2
MQTYLWLTPTKAGRFEVLCEELCGIAHHTMRGAVVVTEQGDFESWLAGHPTYAETLERRPGNAAAGQGLYTTCAACHGQNGEGNQALNAPKLAGQSEWYLRHQLENYQRGLRGTHEDDTYGRQMAPMATMVANEDAMKNVIAYIRTLPDTAAPATIDGDIENGARLYRICAYCHGADGMGVRAVNAPRAAGMSDWYLERQLRYFRDGVRGAHPSDFYGMQMGFMGRNLQTDEAIRDLVAYINTL